MRPLNVVTKSKERKLFQLDGLEELGKIDFPSLIPPNARQVEITYKQKSKDRFVEGEHILKIDYILKLEIKKGDKGE